MRIGLTCPVCDATQIKTVATRKNVDRVIRKKLCGAGHVFITEERVQGVARKYSKLPPEVSNQLDALLAAGNKHAYISAVLNINPSTVTARVKRNKELSK